MNSKDTDDVARKKMKRPRPQVQVVVAQGGFPISSSSSSRTAARSAGRNGARSTQGGRPVADQREPVRKKTKLLDWDETYQEIRALGATAFEGKQKRQYKDEQYKFLTGREPKKQRVPLKIVRGIRKKAAERRARELEEAQKSGLVLPKQQQQQSDKKKRSSSSSRGRDAGPAPSIGFMSKGVLRLKKTP